MIDTTHFHRYIRGIQSLEQRLLEGVQQQIETQKAAEHLEAGKLLSKTSQVLENHAAHFHHHQVSGDNGASPDNGLMASAARALASYYDHEEDSSLSEMLVHNYAALSAVLITYLKAQTMGLALQENEAAAMAENHLADLKTLLTHTGEILPLIVAAEISGNNEERLESPAEQQIIWEG